MTRRALFHFLASAASAVDPERLIWVPGQRVISIPSPVIPLFPAFPKIRTVRINGWEYTFTYTAADIFSSSARASTSASFYERWVQGPTPMKEV